MDKTLKIKILVFSILGILLLSLVLIVFSFIRTDDDRPVTSLRDIPQSDFTYDEMMKVDESSSKSKNNGEFLESYAVANHDGLIDTEGAEPVITNPEETHPASVPVAAAPAPETPVQEPKKPIPARTEVKRSSDPEPVHPEPETSIPVTPVQKKEEATTPEPEQPEQPPEEVKKRRRTGDAFLSANDQPDAKGNVIKAAIHDDQTIISGSTVKIRTIEPFDIDGARIPANTFIYGIDRKSVV